MGGYILRRFIGSVIVMWAVATLVFFMLRLVPGDPIAAMLADAGGPEEMEAMRRRLGLDRSLVVQYGIWFWNMLQGDLGNSIYGSRIPVTQIIVEAIPRTLSLSLLAFVIAMVIALPAGILSATRRNTATDTTVSLFAFLGLSMPDFWLAILLIIVFAANLQWLPAIGYVPIEDGLWQWFRHLILPAIAIGTAFSAIIARMIRSSLLEVLSSDYMRTARAKGLTPRMLMFGHALPNAMIPVITVMGIAFALLISGAVVVENVFAIKGLGRVLIEGILNRDYPVVQGAVLVVSAIFVFSNLLVDLLYGVIDPRIRLH
ncbi:ABC transporter permease [Marinibacterium profundimaris]|uniref:Glutathione ABC transporter permease n=1 Tax=Marinibacterium profundimaris TaxID=1679460 RepID=A0A225NGS7_9RHOB|nr:ABC transporter permease [Marinibacterium profundimaris]OWU72858.1 glutathione ABC transporter permease [Marinibacterium profundimaris]